MANHPLWSDEYWLMLMQLYLRKPVGVKPMYSKRLVALSLELHIPPQFLYSQMLRLRQIDTPRMERLWNTYGENPKKLSRGVKLLRKKMGYGLASLFYDGVEVNESFEKDFKPIPEYPDFTPAMLIMILDLYFRLTPITMVEDTPEIRQLARRLKKPASLIVSVMQVFQVCDPYLKQKTADIPDLLVPCRQIWQRFANDNPQKLNALAAQLHEYFK